MTRAWISITVLWVASCGGSDKPAPQPPANQAPVAMEEDVVDATVDDERASSNQLGSISPDATRMPATGTAARDKASIRAVVRASIPAISLCYEKQLLQSPGLRGTTMVQFTIAPNGTVMSATGTGFDPAVDACVAGVVQGMVFAADAGATTVNYPFKFAPSAP
jgi:outer membrane biosynthesis protein TonB